MLAEHIENIFQEELKNFDHTLSKVDSLLMEFKDVNSKYIHLRSLFAQFINDKSFTKEKTAELLKVHLDIINHLNEINRELLSTISSSFSSKVA
jgi:hypothetical protein